MWVGPDGQAHKILIAAHGIFKVLVLEFMLGNLAQQDALFAAARELTAQLVVHSTRRLDIGTCQMMARQLGNCVFHRSVPRVLFRERPQQAHAFLDVATRFRRGRGAQQDLGRNQR
jgi:hypothetical protein